MYKPLFSIIIPVFNTERYIKECIDSIKSQTYIDWECIIVNDGSTDSSLEFINKVTAEEKRFHIISQENKGPVIAREKAIREAKGEYLVFVDSDDRLVPYALEKFEQEIQSKKPDIIFFNLYGDWDDMTNKIKLPFNDNPIEMTRLLFKGDLPGWLHSKIVKKSYWDKCQIITIPDCYVMEDILITTQLLLNKPEIKIIPDHLYIYNRMNESSLTGKINGSKITKRGIQNLKLIEDILKEKKLLTFFDSEYGSMIMKNKLYYLQSRELKTGIKILPHYHKHLKYYYGLGKKKLVYYIIFNMKYPFHYLFHRKY